MIDFSEASLIALISEYAYKPYQLYAMITLFMLASSFGLPIPEEIVLIAAGLVGHMAKNPHLYPSAEAGGPVVNVTTLAIVCFLAVFLSDVLIYLIGRIFGARILRSSFFNQRIRGATFEKINKWFIKYGGLACGIFRFTPGLRFAGHLSCGFLGVPLWKFMLVDGMAALISVPTQIYIVSEYGDLVLTNLKRFKGALFLVLAVVLISYAFKRIYLAQRKNKV